jgi:adenosylmethionine---8-amino-7-oxononanoate aminotransferase
MPELPTQISLPQPQPLSTRDLLVNWHPASQMRDYQAFAPMQITSAKGSRLTLADGSELLDAISSWWCKSLGHGHPHLLTALQNQAQQFEHVIFANTTHENAVNLSERVLAMANGLPESAWGPDAAPGRQPGHFGKVFYGDSGSCAVEIAMKMALQSQAQRGQTQRTQFASFANGYHGETTGTMSVGDYDIAISPFKSMLFPATLIGNLPYRSGPDDPLWQDASNQWPAIESQLDEVKNNLAAILYEPIMQGAGSMKLYSPDLLARLRTWAKANNVYLIADEIAAGMGRCGGMLASHLTKSQADSTDLVLPDFAVLSKGITGGVLPLSLVLTTDEIYNHFDADYHEHKAFMHSNTYTGHALAIAVALAALDVYANENILDHVAAVGPRLKQSMDQLAASCDYLHNPRGCGMMAAIDIRNPDGSNLDPSKRTGYNIYQHAIKRGALLRPLVDTMYLLPPLNTTASDIEAMIAILKDSLDDVMGK